jgi:hypothetical protein
MEAAAVWSLFADAPWRSGAAAGLLGAGVAATLLLLARRRAAPCPLLEDDSTMGDDDATGFRSSLFAARVCSACSQPMLLEDDGRWRCAGYPVCRS